MFDVVSLLLVAVGAAPDPAVAGWPSIPSGILSDVTLSRSMRRLLFLGKTPLPEDRKERYCDEDFLEDLELEEGLELGRDAFCVCAPRD